MVKILGRVVAMSAALAMLVSFNVKAQVGTIKEVLIKGNKSISESTILSKIKTKAGDVFSQDILNDDLKRLYALGYFTDVSIDIEDHPEGIIVIIIVEEKPVIGEIVFKGNKKLTVKRLQKDMKTKTGEMLNYSVLSQDINTLKELYGKQGFQQVDIKYEITSDKEANTAVVNIIVEEKTRVKIKRVTIEGNKAAKSKVLMSGMKTKPAWLFRKGYFEEETFAEDIERMKRYYQGIGYLDCDITAAFDYDETGTEMYIKLTVNEGPLYTAGPVEINGNLVFPKPEIEKLVTMKEGMPFSHSQVRTDMDAIREFYYQKGYMNVSIDVERKTDPDSRRIDIIYTIVPNDVVYVGDININGNSKTKDIVIRRELRITPGEKYDGDKLRRSKERLYNLGFFEDVYFDTTETSKPDVKDLVVNVKETKTGEFSFGGGYSSVDQLMGFVQITQRNFDILNFPTFTGDGQQLSIRAAIGTVRQDYDLSWTEPWIFDYPLLFGFDLYSRTHSRSSNVGYGYQEVRTGGDLRLGKEITDTLRADSMYKLEEVNISDLSDDVSPEIVEERGANWISTLMVGLTYDTRDNIYNPKKGILTSISVENAGGFLGGDKDFVKSFFSVGWYHSFMQKFVLELRGRTGIVTPYGGTGKVPIYERFFAGGADTIRGYKERRVGPRDLSSNDPIGGEAIALANAEITFPIMENVIKGAVFYDAGNVWAKLKNYLGDGEFKQGTGVGVRVKTPIGPLKLDAAYPLSDNQEDKKQIEWYFSVTNGF